MRIVVTGGSGQLGSYILDDLRLDHEIVGVDVRPPSFPDHIEMVRIADIRDIGAMTNILQGADAVIHTAAQVSVQKSTEDPIFDAEMNVLGTISTLIAARDCGVKAFIYISSAAVYGDPEHIPVDEGHPTMPKSFYGTSKLSAEHYVRAFQSSFGLDYVILRPFNFYSPRADPKSPYSGVITKFIQRAKSGDPLLIEGDGVQTRDFLHARDVVRMLKAVVESEVRNVTFNCGSGTATSINDLAEMVSNVNPGNVKIEHVPPRIGDIKDSYANVSRAENMLGFHTKIGLKEGLETFYQ